MPQQRLNKNYYNFSRGFNSDASPIEFPEGFTIDEQNFLLDINGSRRRRGGLALEDDGTVLSISKALGHVARTHKWSNVAGDPSINLHVLQLGTSLYFFDDGVANPSANQRGFSVDLTARKVGTSTDAEVATSYVDIAYGRGHLFVVGKHVEPFRVEYTAADSAITISQIAIRERDFEGIEDGVTNVAQPVATTTAHTYNLYNRGWPKDYLTTFRTGQSKEPSKNMIPWMGQRRITTASVAEQDWTKEFSHAKLVEELFQDATAPTGHFLRNPFNTATVSLPDSSTTYTIVDWDISGTSGGTQTVTVETSAAHGLVATNSAEISGQVGYYFNGSYYFDPFGGGEFNGYFSFNGTQTVVAAPTTTTFTFTVTFPSDFVSWVSQYAAYGSVSTDLVPNPGGYVSPYRPTSTSFFAGRVWYAGTPYSKVANKVFFSQVIESDAQYGKCYQVADPTQQEFNELVDTDGGVIVIPEMAQVERLLPVGSFLLVFAQNGIWQVGPGASGYFTATSYSVRKIIEIGCTSSASVVVAEGVPHFWASSGIYRITQDANSGFLVAENLTQARLNSFYGSIDIEDKRLSQAVYDDLSKRIYWLYTANAALVDYNYDYALVYDLRLDAFVKLAFVSDTTGYVSTALSIKDTASVEGKVKFVAVTGTGTSITFCDMSDYTAFEDFGISEPEAYIITGHEVLGDASKFRYANYVHVYMYKTETGFDVDYNPIRESEIQMQARWDWSDNSVAGKWGESQQVYRHRRQYVPSSTADTFADGQPVLVTKNKVRGRGRSLALKFTAGTGKDAWLIGWQIEFLANSGL